MSGFRLRAIALNKFPEPLLVNVALHNALKEINTQKKQMDRTHELLKQSMNTDVKTNTQKDNELHNCHIPFRTQEQNEAPSH